MNIHELVCELYANFMRMWPRSEVVTQRSAKPFTPVQIRPWPQKPKFYTGQAKPSGCKSLPRII